MYNVLNVVQMSSVQAPILSLPTTLSPEAQDICNDLRTQIVCFIDALTEMFPHETDFVYVRIFMNDQCRSAYVANKCLQYMLPHRKRILARDDAFFLKHATEIFNQEKCVMDGFEFERW